MQFNQIDALKFFFEMEDTKQAMLGNYRVTAAHQAIYDGVYFNPAHRLAELESKPASSIRYRTAHAGFNMAQARDFMFKCICDYPEESAQALAELGWTCWVDRPVGFEGVDADNYVQLHPLKGVGTGAGFEKIQIYTRELTFFYPWELFDELSMPLPQGLYDLQCFQDMVQALKKSQENRLKDTQ